MQIIITGGGGFLGQKLASALLNSSLAFNELLLVDLKMPARLSDSPRLRCLEADLTQPGVLENVITANTSVVYHLAAIVSSHAEDDFDLGWKVNLDLTRQLLEACRRQPQKIRFCLLQFACRLWRYAAGMRHRYHRAHAALVLWRAEGRL